MDVKDLIRTSYEGEPTSFENAFSEIMATKMADAISARQVEVANSLGSEEAETPEGE